MHWPETLRSRGARATSLRPGPRRCLPASALAALLAPILAAACQPPGGEAAAEGYFRPVVGEQALMLTMVDPAADVVWDAVQTIITPEGTEEIQPRTDEEWDLVRNAAVTVAESGNLLMMGRRMRDEGDWIAWSRDLVDAGAAAMRATEARDPQALFDAGGEIYRACSGCHAQYVQDPALLDAAQRPASE
jgi:hypothetical protein